LPRPTARASCRRWTRRWCGWRVPGTEGVDPHRVGRRRPGGNAGVSP
jgi:hypothetical protein